MPNTVINEEPRGNPNRSTKINAQRKTRNKAIDKNKI